MKVPNTSSVIGRAPNIATFGYQGNSMIKVFAVSATLYSRITWKQANNYSFRVYVRIKCKCLNLRTSLVHIEHMFWIIVLKQIQLTQKAGRFFFGSVYINTR